MPAQRTTELTDLVISIEGKIIDSNFDQFCEELKRRIKGLNKDLKTDSDFETADSNVKALKGAENSLKASKEEALKQASDIQALFESIDDVSAEARDARLGLEKQIKARKLARRAEIIDDAVESIDTTRKSLFRARIEASLKGRSNFERMEWSAQNEAQAIQAEINSTRKVIEAHRETHGPALLHDVDRLETDKAEDVAVELQRRVEALRQKEEQDRLAREKREADARAEAERQKAVAAAEAERKKAAAEAVAAAEPQKQLEPEQPAIPAQREPVAAGITGKTLGGQPIDQKVFTKAEDIMTEAQELQAFKVSIIEALGPVKQARAALKHPANIEKATTFAKSLNDAFVDLAKGGAK